MYLEFYRLTQDPFHITPDPTFLYPSPTHKQAMASIFYGVAKRKGFIAITGEVGVGKTTVLRSCLAKADPMRQRIIHLFNPNVTFREVLQIICRELELSVDTDSLTAMFDAILRGLLELYKQGMNVMLVVDEAQNVPIETLESLRLLSNFETTKDKLIQIVLIGQPELQAKLDRHELRQLKQRIGIRSVIAPLTPEESLAYIDHRLANANSKKEAVFTKGALKRIVKEAGGIPRVINVLCSGALIAGLGYMKKPVSSAIVKEVIAEYNNKPRRAWPRWQFAAVAGCLALAGLFWISPFKNVLVAKSPHSIPIQASLGNTAASPLSSTAAGKDPPAYGKEHRESSNSAPDSTTAKEAVDPADSTLSPPIATAGEANHSSPPAVTAHAGPEHPADAGLGDRPRIGYSPLFVIPAKAGIQGICESLDSGLRRNDGMDAFWDRLLAGLPAKPDLALFREIAAGKPEQPRAGRADFLAFSRVSPVTFKPDASTDASDASNDAGETVLPQKRQPSGSTAPLKPSNSQGYSVTRSDDNVTITVEKGQNLSELIFRHYGSADARLIQLVQSYNPLITDANRIWPGEVIILPRTD